MVNDELEMLEYRLNLHHSIVSKFVIVESNLTFKGLPKTSHVKSLLSTGKLDQFNIEVLQVPFSQSERESNDTWVRQTATRRFIGYWISQHYPNARIKKQWVCFCEQISRKFMILVINSPQYVNLMVNGT